MNFKYLTINIKQRAALLFVVICAFAFAKPTFSQSLASTPAGFIDIGMGARPMAMAGAYSAVAQDASALFWNPAGLTGVEGWSIFLTRASQFGILPYNALAVGFDLGEKHHLAGGTINSGDEELQESTFLIGYAYKLGKIFRALPIDLSAGVNIKWQFARFGDNGFNRSDYSIFTENDINDARSARVQGNASGTGIDLGFKLRAAKYFYYSITWMNAINTLKWNNGEETYSEGIPGKFAVSMAYHPRKTYQMTIELARSSAVSNPMEMRIGAERLLWQRVQMRGGLNQNLSDEPNRQYALGLGLIHKAEDLVELFIDFAYVIHPLANSQRFSLMMNF